MAVSLPNVNRSMRRPPRNPRPRETTSAGPYKLNTLRLNPRPLEVRHHHQQKRHRKHVARRPKYRPQMVISRLRPPKLRAHLAQLLDQSDPHAIHNDRSPTTQPLALLPSLLPGPRLVVLDFPREETHMDSPLSQQWLPPMPKVDSHSQKESSTRYHPICLSLSPPCQVRLASDSPARSERNRFNSVLLEEMQRVVTGDLTPSLRLLVA
jgi:hypothetical protein